jgi:hypothetical protein
MVIKDLGVQAKLDVHGVKIRTTIAGDNGKRTQGLRDAKGSRELVHGSDNVGNLATMCRIMSV